MRALLRIHGCVELWSDGRVRVHVFALKLTLVLGKLRKYWTKCGIAGWRTDVKINCACKEMPRAQRHVNHDQYYRFGCI